MMTMEYCHFGHRANLELRGLGGRVHTVTATAAANDSATELEHHWTDHQPSTRTLLCETFLQISIHPALDSAGKHLAVRGIMLGRDPESN